MGTVFPKLHRWVRLPSAAPKGKGHPFGCPFPFGFRGKSKCSAEMNSASAKVGSVKDFSQNGLQGLA